MICAYARINIKTGTKKLINYRLMEHLIANSGIHFITTEREFNPAEQLAFPSGKTLKYAFCETADFITGEQIFDLLYYHSQDGVYVPFDELRQSGKTLTLTQCGAQKGEWTIGDGQGPNEWDSKNRGCRQLLFTVTATAEGTADIAVKFSF